MPEIANSYRVFVRRKDVDKFHSIVSNFEYRYGSLEILFNSLYAGYRLKMHESEIIVLKLSIEDISIM